MKDEIDTYTQKQIAHALAIERNRSSLKERLREFEEEEEPFPVGSLLFAFGGMLFLIFVLYSLLWSFLPLYYFILAGFLAILGWMMRK